MFSIFQRDLVNHLKMRFELTEKMNLPKNSYPAHIVLKDTYLMVVKLLGGWLDLVLGGYGGEEDTRGLVMNRFCLSSHSHQ